MKRILAALAILALSTPLYAQNASLLGTNSAQTSAATPNATSSNTTYVPLGGGTMTGPLYNSTIVTAKLVGSLLQVDQFEGGDVSAKVNTCLQAAHAAGGGTCDARVYAGHQTLSQTIEVLPKTTLLLPHSGYWCWGLMDGTSVGIQQDGSSQVIGPAVGGGGNNMLLLPCSSSTRMLALYATQDHPISGGQYVYATGFNAQNLIGATFTKGVIYTRYLFDESRYERVTAINNNGDAWHIYSVCCDTNFQEVQAASAYGSNGGTPLVVERASGDAGSEFSWSGTINSAGAGHPNIDIQAGNYTIDFWNLYTESGDTTPGSSTPADVNTAVVNIAGTPIVRFHGGLSSMNTTKPCFNNPALVTVNNNWCSNSSLPALNAPCPSSHAIYGTDSKYLYICAGDRVRRLELE